MEWYYARDGKQEGPVSAAQLKQLASAGKLDPDDMVFKIGSKDWVPASTVSGLFGKSSSVAASPPPSPGGFEFGGESEKGATPSKRKASRDRVDVEEDEDAPRPRSRSGRGGGLPIMDYVLFKLTIQSWGIPVVFWSMVLFTVYQAGKGLYSIVTNLKYMTFGLLVDFFGLFLAGALGLVALRVSFEVMRAIFQIHETLVENKKGLDRQQDK